MSLGKSRQKSKSSIGALGRVHYLVHGYEYGPCDKRTAQGRLNRPQQLVDVGTQNFSIWGRPLVLFLLDGALRPNSPIVGISPS